MSSAKKRKNPISDANSASDNSKSDEKDKKDNKNNIKETVEDKLPKLYYWVSFVTLQSGINISAVDIINNKGANQTLVAFRVVSISDNPNAWMQPVFYDRICEDAKKNLMPKYPIDYWKNIKVTCIFHMGTTNPDKVKYENKKYFFCVNYSILTNQKGTCPSPIFIKSESELGPGTEDFFNEVCKGVLGVNYTKGSVEINQITLLKAENETDFLAVYDGTKSLI